MARITVEELAEAARHVYGGVCGRPGCIWCQEWPKVKAEIDRQGNADLADILRILPPPTHERKP